MMNKWQKKIMRGGFAGQKVRRKVIRSSITDLHSSAGYIVSKERCKMVFEPDDPPSCIRSF